MNLPDIGNSFFQFFGGVFVLNHCRVLLKQKQVHGLSIVSIAFFAVWGYWNLFFFTSQHLWFSLVGDLLNVTGNTLYVVLLIKYRKRT